MHLQAGQRQLQDRNQVAQMGLEQRRGVERPGQSSPGVVEEQVRLPACFVWQHQSYSIQLLAATRSPSSSRLVLLSSLHCCKVKSVLRRKQSASLKSTPRELRQPIWPSDLHLSACSRCPQYLLPHFAWAMLLCRARSGHHLYPGDRPVYHGHQRWRSADPTPAGKGQEGAQGP